MAPHPCTLAFARAHYAPPGSRLSCAQPVTHDENVRYAAAKPGAVADAAARGVARRPVLGDISNTHAGAAGGVGKPAAKPAVSALAAAAHSVLSPPQQSCHNA
jgi:hypothetical protein